MFTPWSSSPAAVARARLRASAGVESLPRVRAAGRSGTPSLTRSTWPPSSSAATKRPGAPAEATASCRAAVRARNCPASLTFRPSSRTPAGAALSSMLCVKAVIVVPSKVTKRTWAAFASRDMSSIASRTICGTAAVSVVGVVAVVGAASVVVGAASVVGAVERPVAGAPAEVCVSCPGAVPPQPEASTARPSDAATRAASTNTMGRACLTGRGYTCGAARPPAGPSRRRRRCPNCPISKRISRPSGPG